MAIKEWISLALTIGSLLSLGSRFALAAEPYFCAPEVFLAHEIDAADYLNAPTRSRLDRLHVFQIGSLKLAGLAVGNSETSALKEMADVFGKVDERKKYCTWYFNDGDRAKTKTFNWKYLNYPVGSVEDHLATYVPTLKSVIQDDAVSFLNCAESQNFVAFGCDAMQHRGPSAFAMFLSYLGCSPRNSVAISVKIWGRNGIEDSMRTALAGAAQAMGEAHLSERERLLKSMQ